MAENLLVSVDYSFGLLLFFMCVIIVILAIIVIVCFISMMKDGLEILSLDIQKCGRIKTK